jgi:hypothetical protein
MGRKSHGFSVNFCRKGHRKVISLKQGMILVKTHNVGAVIDRPPSPRKRRARPNLPITYAAKQKHHPDGWCFVGGEGEI